MHHRFLIQLGFMLLGDVDITGFPTMIPVGDTTVYSSPPEVGTLLQGQIVTSDVVWTSSNFCLWLDIAIYQHFIRLSVVNTR
jgi:hypothetical protein